MRGDRAVPRRGEIKLADGRVLAYAEWGPSNGWPLLHFHGIPDGRFSWGAGPACEDRGIRLIAIDRPGVGRSDPKPGRSVADWAADVKELAGQLEVDRFSVSGQSAGGPYALACASRLTDRVRSAALISGVGPLDQPGFVEQMHTARAWRLAAHLPVWFEDAGHVLPEDRSEEILDALAADGQPVGGLDGTQAEPDADGDPA